MALAPRFLIVAALLTAGGSAAAAPVPPPAAPKPPPKCDDPEARAKVQKALYPAAAARDDVIRDMERELARLREEIERPASDSPGPRPTAEQIERLKIELAAVRAKPAPPERPRADAAFEALGVGAKAALRELAAGKAAGGDAAKVAVAAETALYHIRRTQVRDAVIAATGRTAAAEDVATDVLELPAAADRVEAADDGTADEKALCAEWRKELNAAVGPGAGKREVSAAEVAAWLLVAARPGVPPEGGGPDDLAFLDPSRNPALAKALASADTARPFRHLVNGWLDRQGGDAAPPAVRATAAPFLKGWK